MTVPLIWAAAENEARRLGGHLATVRSQAEQDWLFARFGAVGNLWLGLNDEAVEGTFTWSSGEPVGYANWNPGEPNNAGLGEDYVEMVANFGGRWNDAGGILPRPGIVELVQNGGNGLVYTRSAPASWVEAEAEAEALGGHLATVRSQGEQAWMQSTFGSGDLWIGLNDAAVEGTFVWSSGEPVGYTNWAPGEPNNAGAGEDHVHLDGDHGGRWSDAAGSMVMPGVLEFLPRASYSFYGAGCGGTRGVPELRLVSGRERPIMGQTFRIRVASMPPGAFALGAIGLTDRTAGGLPLPLHLAAYGMPDCDLYTDSWATFPLFASLSGDADWDIFLPSDPDWLNVAFFQQALVLDPGANRGGAVLSNAGRGNIGGR